ncbi:MAG: hypothetical protein S4CHLAM81_03450 [Chlamydiales bacterium]|nr:hypothetical protein [Chlamydiales bacterium]MCH9635135.1 hypothetical protein [Chlamydiales bacterium]
MDLYEATLNLMGALTNPVGHLHRTWDDFFKSASDGAVFLQICPSQGAVLVRNALMISSEKVSPPHKVSSASF